MTNRQNVSPTLLALTASALAIPGMARADDVPAAPEAPASSGTQVDYRYSNYREDKLPGSKTGGANGKRYDVDSHQFHVSIPFDDATDLAANLTYETMSGASPWFITPNASNKPVQVMSGATIKDDRKDLLLQSTRRFTGYSGTIQAGYSDERDYSAANVGVEGSYDYDEGITVTGGLGYSDDKVEPTDGRTTRFPGRVSHEKRNSVTGYAGLAYVFDADTVMQTSISYTHEDGFLSDPYKLAYIVSAANTVQDSRPDGRKLFAWLVRARHYFPGVKGALHADYRYFEDDWDITAHTVDLSWHQSFGDGFTVVPGLRWYSQSEAFFYAPFFSAPRGDNLYTSDYRLSPYGAISLSLEATKKFDILDVSLRYEHYNSNDSYATGKVRVANPGLVDFDVFSIGLRKTF